MADGGGMRAVEIGADGRGALAAALAAAGLPTDAIDAPDKLFFAFHDQGGELVGYGGLELCPPAAVLRSLLVLGPARGRGHGRTMVSWLVAEASRRGVRRLYLLTLDAAGFFAMCGFAPTARAAVPPSVAATREFAALCPDSATCMSRAIER